MTHTPPSQYRRLTDDESAIHTCSTVGCEEPPRWVHTLILPGGIFFAAECEGCKATFAGGSSR